MNTLRASISASELGRQKAMDGKKYKYTQHVIPDDNIYWNYSILFLCSVCSSMSVSSFPGIVETLKKELNIEEGKIGILTTMYYLGSLFGKNINITNLLSILGGTFILLVINFNIRKYLVLFTLSGSCICTLLIASIKGYYVLFFVRFFNGFCVVLFAIFNPVWVDQFAPQNSKSIMMALHHLESILGTVIGYLLTARLSLVINWRYSFLIQSILLGTFFFVVSMIGKILFSRTLSRISNTEIFILTEIIEDEENVEMSNNKKENIDSTSKEVLEESTKDNTNNLKKSLTENMKVEFNTHHDDGSENKNQEHTDKHLHMISRFKPDHSSMTSIKINEGESGMSYIQIFCNLINNKLYVLQVLVIAVLTFIVTVIQQWMKSYLVNVIKVDPTLADFLFIVFCLTSPLVGVMFGGFYIQKRGGYASLNCSYFVMFNASMCFIISIIVAFVTDFVLFSVLMWFFLFFGSSMVPCIGGSVLSTLPLRLKGSGYSLQNVAVNIIGLTPSPSIYGFIYENTKNTAPTFAFSICLSLSGVGVVLMILVIYFRTHGYVREDDSLPEEIVEKAIHSQDVIVIRKESNTSSNKVENISNL